jgi:hypothetical protein
VKLDDRIVIYGVAGLVGVAVVYFAGKKLAELGGGVLSGDNSLTRSQTDAAGNSTDAYVGKGVLGTAGAVVNTATGGFAASIGQTLGGWAFDMFGPKIDVNAPVSPLQGN